MRDFFRKNSGMRSHAPRRNDVPKARTFVELRIEKMVQGGEGLAHLADGRVCFVKNALPGELCKVMLTLQKKDFTRGSAVEILEASADRVKPKCPLYGKCGGCSLQHLASEKQAEYLETVERENFRRLAHAELPTDFVIHTGNAWGYRNRARVVYSGNRRNPESPCFAFREQESDRLIPFEKCPVLTDGLNQFLKGTLKNLLEKSAANRALPRDLDINVFDNGDGQVSFYYRGMNHESFLKNSISIVKIGGCEIEADASVFFQSNLNLLPELVNAVRNAVDEGIANGEASDEWLIDLFSGVGFFAAMLRDRFKKITTVERDDGCLKHAKVNLSATWPQTAQQPSSQNSQSLAAAQPQVENVSAPAEEWLVQNVVDVPATLIVDPPRTGLPPEALDAIVKSSVNRLIYVSCDPVTLARDYAKFASAGFSLKHAEGFAFYPQTPHLEMMFVLSR